jgi:hypothetical protein
MIAPISVKHLEKADVKQGRTGATQRREREYASTTTTAVSERQAVDTYHPKRDRKRD